MPSSVSSFMSRISGKSGNGKEYQCTVQLLDDSESMNVTFKKGDTGQTVFDKVCEYVQLVERDYFGLRYMDVNKHRYWLDPMKPVLKQIQGVTPIVFCLRVRYYPTDPSIVKEELTRYQIFLQIRRDMLHGRLYCPHNDATYLGACILQSEIGDYDPQDHKENYVSEYKLFLKQTAKLEDNVAEEHKNMSGDVPSDAEFNFLRRVSTLDTYGFDPYTVKDNSTGKQVYVGFTPNGLMVYHMNRKTHHVPYIKVDKVDYAGKEFRVYLSDQEKKPQEENNIADGTTQDNAINDTTEALNGSALHEEMAVDAGDLTDVAIEATELTAGELNVSKAVEAKEIVYSEENTLRFTCPSGTYAKHLWKYALSQRAFFTNDSADAVKPQTASWRVPIFVRGSTFRYSGRVLNEIVEEKTEKRETPIDFVRYHVERQPGRDQRAYPWTNSATLPRTNKESNGKATSDSTTKSNGKVLSSDDIQVKSTTTETASPTIKTSELPDSPSKHSPIVDVQQPEISLNRIVNSNTYDSMIQDEIEHGQPSPPSRTSQNSNLPHIKTTKATVIMSKREGVNGKAITEQPTTNKVIVVEETKQNDGFCINLLRLFFTILIISIFIGTIVVIVMETTSIRNSVDNIPYAPEFRHLHYEPLKDVFIKKYNELRQASGM